VRAFPIRFVAATFAAMNAAMRARVERMAGDGAAPRR